MGYLRAMNEVEAEVDGICDGGCVRSLLAKLFALGLALASGLRPLASGFLLLRYGL